MSVPANDADGSYTVSWGAVTHATTYQLYEGGSRIHNSSARSKGISGKLTGTYGYKVRSCNTLGDCGAFSGTKNTRVSRTPAVPSLNVPANDADGSYTISWGAATHATSYQLYEGSSLIHNSSARSKAFSGKSSAVYSYKVRACNALGDCGTYSTVKTTRVSRIPAAPALTVPATDPDGAYSVSWGAVTHATTYQLVEGSSTVHNSSARSKAFSGKSSAVYSYKVRACNALGDCGAYSTVKTTRVSRIPSAPALTVPANDPDGAYSVSWGAVTHATSYQLVEGSSTVHNSSTRSKAFSGKISAVYSYKVRACNALGDCGSYSTVKTTRVSRIPAAPALTAPANDADGSYTISWGAATHAATYQLYEGSSLIHNSSARSKGVAGKLTGTYGYKVRSCNTLGDCGAFSGTKNTRVSRTPAVPSLSVPANDADGSYTISWGAATHAATYQLYEGSSLIHNSSARSKGISGKLTGTYGYKVRACNAYGACSGFSGTKSTKVSRTPAVPSLSVPANDADGSYTISWGAATHAATYQLYEGSSLIHNSSARSKGISGKLTGTYGYKVRACNAYGACSGFSGTKSTKVSRTPAVPSLSAPSTDGDGSYTVSWGAVTHATRYEVYEGGSRIHNAGGTSKSISGKTTGSYAYKVKACNSVNACSGFSAVKTTVVNITPGALTCSAPSDDGDGSYAVSWGAVPGAATYQLYEGSSLIYSGGGSSKSISGKLTGTYAYQGRSCNSLGACSSMASCGSTRVSLQPGIPALSVPPTDGDGSYTVSWGTATHGTSYKLYELVMGYTTLKQHSSSRSFSVSGRSSLTYGYKVQACNALGGCGQLSAVKSVVVSTCDPNAWTPNNGLTVAQTAQTCTTGSTFNYSETDGCGGSRTNKYPCAGCDANVWSCTYGNGKTIAQCAAACNAPSTFPITNDCGGTVYYGGSAGQCTGTPPPPAEPQWSAWMGISRSYRFVTYKSYSGAVRYQQAYWNGVLVYNFSFGGGGGVIRSWVHGGYRYERGGAKQGPYSYDYTTWQIRRKAL